MRAMSDPVYSSDTARMRWPSSPGAEATIHETSEQTACISPFQLVNASWDIARGSFNTLANESHAYGRKAV